MALERRLPTAYVSQTHPPITPTDALEARAATHEIRDHTFNAAAQQQTVLEALEPRSRRARRRCTRDGSARTASSECFESLLS